mgnify:CR=1 FL=1
MIDLSFYFKPENFYPFLKEVLKYGFELLEEKPNAEMCYFLAREDLKDKRMLAVPRNCFKTTILNGFVIWDICRNLYNEQEKFSYLLDSATKNLVVWNLKFIKRHLANNDKLIEYFGEFKGTKYWGKESIVIKQQEDIYTNQVSKEPTIMVSSVDSSITGFHFKTVVADDWITDKTIRTAYALERVALHYKEIMRVIDPEEGKLYIACTFWTNGDIYADILKEKKDEFDFLIKPIYEEKNDKIELFFPKRFPMTKIKLLKKTMGNQFYNQYMLTPIPEDERVFPEKHYQEIERQNIPEIIASYIVYDPAETGSHRPCLDALLGIGVDSNYNQYLLDCIIEEGRRMDANQVIQNIVFLASKYGSTLRGIMVEKILGGKFFRALFENYCKQNNLPYTSFYMEENTDKSIVKKDRIRILEMPWKNNQIFISKEIPQEIRNEVREEFITFDKCKYYDILDAWAMIAKYIIFRSSKREEEAKKNIPLLQNVGNKILINPWGMINGNE